MRTCVVRRRSSPVRHPPSTSHSRPTCVQFRPDPSTNCSSYASSLPAPCTPSSHTRTSTHTSPLCFRPTHPLLNLFFFLRHAPFSPIFFFLMIRPPPRSPLFPYPTLSR